MTELERYYANHNALFGYLTRMGQIERIHQLFGGRG